MITCQGSRGQGLEPKVGVKTFAHSSVLVSSGNANLPHELLEGEKKIDLARWYKHEFSFGTLIPYYLPMENLLDRERAGYIALASDYPAADTLSLVSLGAWTRKNLHVWKVINPSQDGKFLSLYDQEGQLLRELLTPPRSEMFFAVSQNLERLHGKYNEMELSTDRSAVKDYSPKFLALEIAKVPLTKQLVREGVYREDCAVEENKASPLVLTSMGDLPGFGGSKLHVWKIENGSWKWRHLTLRLKDQAEGIKFLSPPFSEIHVTIESAGLARGVELIEETVVLTSAVAESKDFHTDRHVMAQARLPRVFDFGRFVDTPYRARDGKPLEQGLSFRFEGTRAVRLTAASEKKNSGPQSEVLTDSGEIRYAFKDHPNKKEAVWRVRNASADFVTAKLSVPAKDFSQLVFLRPWSDTYILTPYSDLAEAILDTGTAKTVAPSDPSVLFSSDRIINLPYVNRKGD